MRWSRRACMDAGDWLHVVQVIGQSRPKGGRLLRRSRMRRKRAAAWRRFHRLFVRTSAELPATSWD